MSSDLLRTSIREVVLEEQGPVDTLACYEGEVAGQSGDLLDVKLDDPRFGPGVSKIPYRTGIPGASVTVPTGTRVAVGFENGRRDCPVVRYFAAGTPLTIEIDASTSVTITAEKATVEADTIELKGGSNGEFPTEHIASVEAVANLINLALYSLATGNPGPWTGAMLAPPVPNSTSISSPIALAVVAAIKAAAIPGIGGVPPVSGDISPFKSVIDEALESKLPNATGLLPGVGWADVKGG